jgi:predicted ATPase
MLEHLRKRLEELLGTKEQQIANINAIIGRELELRETIEMLEKQNAAPAPSDTPE